MTWRASVVFAAAVAGACSDRGAGFDSPASAGSAGVGMPIGGSGGASSAQGGAAGNAGATVGGGGASAGQPASVSDCKPEQPQSLFCNPLQPMPKTLKETGLFPAAPSFDEHPASLRAFTPFPALWSDGMHKQRYLLLPPGQKIDNSNPTSWVFPVGTVLVKNFLDDGGPGGAQRIVETRVIRRVGDATAFTEYDYYLYRWNPEGTDAELLVDDRNGDSSASVNVPITINHLADGAPLVINEGKPFDHALPSRDMCSDCHHENGNTYQTFVGFDEIRLNTKLSASDTMTQLERFLADGVFMYAPTAPPRAIVETDPKLLSVEQFVLGNCVHCHNEKGKVFDLAPEVFVQNTVGQKTNAQSVEPPAGWLRVFPGEPEKSVVFVQARRSPLPEPTLEGGDRLRPMPPMGVNDLAPDPNGIAALKDWITSLQP
ncbi:MAG TPA: hypothetical protein VHB79_02300 [Polyangiaceae bacterium]|nr:hypothetical protein [Polyangiaceae bacterium]